MNRLLFLFFMTCFWIISVKFKESINSESKIGNDSQWDDFAIALKTGKEVALERAPIQLLTFLADVKNKIIIGNGPNVTVGEMEVIDVITDLYTHTPSNLRKSKIFTS